MIAIQAPQVSTQCDHQVGFDLLYFQSASLKVGNLQLEDRQKERERERVTTTQTLLLM